MGAWKKLNQQDVYVTSYTAKKSWNASASTLDNYGIQVLQATTSSNLAFYLSDETPYSGSNVGNGYYPTLVYKSISQLYYKNHNTSSGELISSSSFEFYKESSFASSSRALGEKAMVYSVPRSKFGTHIEPGSLTFGSTGDSYMVNQADYIGDDYFLASEALYDDGEGNLRVNGTTGGIVGNIIYSHGQFIITDSDQELYYRSNPLGDLTWKSNQPIYTYNYTVRLSDFEFNYTQNPTAVTGSDNSLRSNLTGTEFQPYVTTVGLYNDANELIAVAKLAKPLPKSKNTETTIQIKLDI